MRDVLEMTDGALRLWPATLYGSLEELRAQGLIDDLEETPAGESERKRFYRITGKGRRELVAETRRLGSEVALARRRLGEAP
jgi:DNA-binding PadR family transcriptional regulator